METTTTATVIAPATPKQWVGIISAVASIASRDKSRAHLAGVRVEEEGNDLILTATDAYRLLNVTIQGAGGNGWEPFTVDAKGFVGAAKQTKGARVFTLAPENGAVTVIGSAGADTVSSVRVPTIDGRFPDWRSLLVAPSEAWPTNKRVRFDASLFGGLLEACAMISGYSDTPRHAPLPNVDIVRMSPAKPTLVTGSAANGVSFRGLMMPIRQ